MSRKHRSKVIRDFEKLLDELRTEEDNFTWKVDKLAIKWIKHQIKEYKEKYPEVCI